MLSSPVDKVTTGTYNLVSVILNVAFAGLLTAPTAGFASLVALLVNTQFSDHIKTRFIAQLTNGISSVLQKFLKCFNGTAISTSFVL